MRRLVLVLSLSLLAAPALAQNQVANQVANQAGNQAAKPAGSCDNRSVAQPATGAAPAARDGTAPGNSGSTGWSGGTGGSFIGTNNAGSLASSPTWQPPTARGLDPIANPVRPASAC